MPTKRKRSNWGHQTSKAAEMRNRRAERTEDQMQLENTNMRVRIAQLRQVESEDTRVQRIELRLEQIQEPRFTVDRRRTNDQQRQQLYRSFISDLFLRLTFEYEPETQYYAHLKIVIGGMEKEWPHCHALKFKNEPEEMCCASGKVQLPEIETPPE